MRISILFIYIIKKDIIIFLKINLQRKLQNWNRCCKK